MAVFDDLIKRASEFVEKQKGAWDESKWQGFLSDAQKQGVKLTEDMQNNIGLMLESFKKFYESSADAGKNMIGNVSDQSAKFVEKSKGTWEHLEWEKFLKDAQQRGIDLTEEAKANLGGILESAKKFYSSLPLTAKEEKKEPEAKAPEKVEAPKAPEKPVKPPMEKKVEAKKPKKEEKTPVKKKTKAKFEEKPEKEEKKVVKKEVKEAKKAEKTKTVKTVKVVPPKKEAAKKPTVKKLVAKETTKTKGATASKKKS